MLPGSPPTNRGSCPTGRTGTRPCRNGLTPADPAEGETQDFTVVFCDPQPVRIVAQREERETRRAHRGDWAKAVTLAQLIHAANDQLPGPLQIVDARRPVDDRRGMPIGRWTVVAWERHRFLPPYAVQFVEEFVVRCQRAGRELIQRAPAIPRPAAPARKPRPPKL
jgi:hypothetical protein